MKSGQEEKLIKVGRKLKLLTANRAKDHSHGVFLDTLRFTAKLPAIVAAGLATDQDEFVIDPIQSEIQRVRDLAWHFAQLLGFQLGESRNGRDYYAYTYTIEDAEGYEMASVSGGGQMQRESYLFSMKGMACMTAKKGWEVAVHAFASQVDATITRIDLAKDYYSGEYTAQSVIDAYQNDEFSYRGRKPSIDDHGLIKGHSTTIYIGKRESGKMARFYDKSHQYGIFDEHWWRAEIELRNENRVIPLDAIINPAGYFAGAYSFCNRILEEATPIAVPASLKTSAGSAERLTRWFERTVAPALTHITQALDSYDWVFDMAERNCSRPKPQALRGHKSGDLKAGLQHAIKRLTLPNLPPLSPSVSGALGTANLAS